MLRLFLTCYFSNLLKHVRKYPVSILNKKLSEIPRPQEAMVLGGEEGNGAGDGHRTPVELHAVLGDQH